jgi:hypothetical protein
MLLLLGADGISYLLRVVVIAPFVMMLSLDARSVAQDFFYDCISSIFLFFGKLHWVC